MDFSEKRSLHDEGSPGVEDSMFVYSGAGDGGCCCLFAPRYLQRRSASTPPDRWDRMYPGGGGVASGATVGLWNRGIQALMKAREWSELVAGPRWKTFIRRFNRKSRCSSMGRRFQYDPFSYALNFDEGVAGSASPEIDAGLRNFSSRYAFMPPEMARMDLASFQAPPVTAVTTPVH